MMLSIAIYNIVPDAPTGLKVIPRYSYSSGHFSGITVEFNSEVVKVDGYIILIFELKTTDS